MNLKLLKNSICCLGLLLANSAAGQPLFIKTYGGTVDEATGKFIQTSDGDFAIAGNTESYGTGGKDALLLRTDSAGNLKWSCVIGLVNDDGIGDLIQTDDGGFICVGTSYSFTTNGSSDIYIVRIDSLGNMTWAKAYGGYSFDAGYRIIKTPDGNFLIGGTSKSFSIGSTFNSYYLKIDIDGNVLWNRSIGGLKNQGTYAVKPLAGGGYIATGYVIYSTYQEVLVLKLNSAGNVVWCKGISNAKECAGWDIIETHDSGYAIAGTITNGTFGEWDGYVVKLDASGNIEWTRTAGGSSYDGLSAIQETSNGNLLAAGYVQGSISHGSLDLYLLELDSLGIVVSSRVIGTTGKESAACMINTLNGGFALSGITEQYGNGGADIFLMTLDAFGNGCEADTSAGVFGSSGTIHSISCSVTNGDTVISGGIATIGSVQTNVCEATGIRNIDVPSCLSIFPQPCSGSFQISLPDPIHKAPVFVDVYTFEGLKIYSGIFSTTAPLKIDLKQPPPGLYQIMVRSETLTYSGKLLIR